MRRSTSLFGQINTLMLFFAFLMITSCNSKRTNTNTNGKLEGKISISGAFALYPLAVKWADEFKKIHPEVKIDVSAGGVGKGITDALSGMVDLGMVSRGINAAEVAKGAFTISVTKDAVLPTISDKNPVLAELKQKGITKERLAQIFLSGNINSWGTNLVKVDNK